MPTTKKPTRQPTGFRQAYRTSNGTAYIGESLEMLRKVRTGSVDLALTSPPYPLSRQKAYGNKQGAEYLAWLRPFVREIHRMLKPSGSFVLDLGGTWEPGRPVKSVYQYELLLSVLTKRPRFLLAQDFFWLNTQSAGVDQDRHGPGARRAVG